MKQGTPEIPTEELNQSEKYILWHGKFLRKFSLDEIPQLIHIISGKMTFVGPRPALFNQGDLIVLRKENGVEHLMPGLTGLALKNQSSNCSAKTGL